MAISTCVIASVARQSRLYIKAPYGCRERSVVLCHRERSVAISPFVCWQTEKTRLLLRLAFLCHREFISCHREARGDLAFRVLANRKDEIVSQGRIFMSSRANILSSRAQRGDLACPQPANRQKRDCFAGSQPPKGAMTVGRPV